MSATRLAVRYCALSGRTFLRRDGETEGESGREQREPERDDEADGEDGEADADL